jgi:hypothetical protein
MQYGGGSLAFRGKVSFDTAGRLGVVRMKHLAIKRPDQPSRTRNPRRTKEGAEASDAAFDLWLQRSLHQLFDKVAKEPIPEELLRLIKDDCAKDDCT